MYIYEVCIHTIVATYRDQLLVQAYMKRSHNDLIGQVGAMTHCGEYKTLLLVIMCPGLVDPANGRMTVTGNLPGDTATYTCDPGYNLVGIQNLTCGDNGLWSGSPPFCQGAVGMKTVLYAYLDNLLMYGGYWNI